MSPTLRFTDEEPDYIMADGELLDINKMSARHVVIPGSEESNYDRAAADPWYKADYEALTKGLTVIDGTAEYNSVVGLFGEKAFPVALSSVGDVTIAGATYGDVFANM